VLTDTDPAAQVVFDRQGDSVPPVLLDAADKVVARSAATPPLCMGLWATPSLAARACLTQRDLHLGHTVQFSNAAVNLTDHALREWPKVYI
jgi:hypothetical protein